MNKNVKSYLRRFLQNASANVQAESWPILLPGIADEMNKSYHSTIDDIPFRIYRNREASSLECVFKPDDVSFTTCSNEVQVDEESEDDDYYEEEYEYDDNDNEIGTDSSPMTEQ